MRGSEMAQQPEQSSALGRDGARTTPHPNPPPQGGREYTSALHRPNSGGLTLRVLGVLATVAILGTALAACGRCGGFLSSSLGQIGVCHSDAPQQH